MDCGRAPTALAAAGPARAPARRAGSVAKWAASHSSMQPESCRFNRGLANISASAGSLRPKLGFITECGETVDSWCDALADHALHDHGCVGAPETKRIRQRDIDLAFTRHLRHEINRRFYRRVVKIDGRRGDVIANRKNTEDRLDRSGGAQKMPGRRFGR